MWLLTVTNSATAWVLRYRAYGPSGHCSTCRYCRHCSVVRERITLDCARVTSSSSRAYLGWSRAFSKYCGSGISQGNHEFQRV